MSPVLNTTQVYFLSFPQCETGTGGASTSLIRKWSSGVRSGVVDKSVGSYTYILPRVQSSNLFFLHLPADDLPQAHP